MLARDARALTVTILAVALASVDLGVRIFLTNDEARFPVLAESMLQGGSWLAPHLNGSVYFNKPVLLAWLIAAASWPLGHVSQFTAVIPSALAGVAIVLCIYRIGVELLGPEAALCSALVAASTQGLFVHERLPMPDILLVSMETASVWMLVRMWRQPSGAAWWGFYGFMGAAFWAKGLAGLLPLGIGLGVVLQARSGLTLRSLRLGRGLALLACATAPWWIVGLSIDAPEVHRAVVVDQLRWYLPQRPTAFMFIAPLQHLVGILFPWIVVLPWAALAAWRVPDSAKDDRNAVRLVLTWAMIAMAIIAPAGEQRVRYYLPTLAPFALLIGWWLAGLAVSPPRAARLSRLLPYAAGAALLVVSALIAALSRPGGPRADIWLAMPGSWLEMGCVVTTAGAMGVALVWGGMRQRLHQTWPIAFVAAATLVFVLYHGEVARRNRSTDLPAAVPIFRSELANLTTLAAWDLPNLPLDLYLGRRVTAVDDAVALQALSATSPSLGLLAGRAARSGIAQLPGVHVTREVSLGTERVLIASVTPGVVPDRSIAGPTDPPRPLTTSAREPSTSIPGAELASILLAIGGCALRRSAFGNDDRWGIGIGCGAVIAGLATFPRSWSVLAVGTLVALGWIVLSEHRPRWPSTLTCLALVLLLPLGLDAIEDLMEGRAVSGDTVWLSTAAVGVALLVMLEWRRRESSRLRAKNRAL